MIRRIVLSLALVCGAGAASAQEQHCTLYKVNTSMLNVSKDAGGHIYNDALFDGDVTCVTRLTNVRGVDWAFISYKLDNGNAHTPVEGWAALQYLQQTDPPPKARRRPALLPRPLPPTAAAPPSTAAAPALPPLPPGAGSPGGAKVASRPEDVLRF